MAEHGIKITNNELFVKEVTEKLLFDDLFSKTKTDICETLVNIANQCSDSNFLFEMSNYDLSALLRIKQAKVKSLKESISVRFMDTQARDKLFYTFLDKLVLESNASKSKKEYEYIIGDNEKDENSFVIYVEDNCLKNEIERRLKMTSFKSLDYSFNREKLIIQKADFIQMLAMTFAPGNKNCRKELQIAIEKDIEKEKLKEVAKYLETFAAGEKCIIAIKAIITLAHFVFNKITKK